MPDLEILSANRGLARRAFLDLPYRLYAQEPMWATPLRRDQKKILDSRRHPFYRHAELELFVARRGRRVVGRIAAILDHNGLPENGRRIGSFGFFESEHDEGAARGLTDAAGRWLRERGADVMRGPVNPSFAYGSAVLIEGFDDPPAIGTSYNPPYYDSLLRQAGLEPAKEFLAFALTREQMRAGQALAGRFGVASPKVRLRPYDIREREREARWIWELHSKGFTENYDFVPMSLDEVRAMARDIERYGDERFVQFCEVDGRPAGIVVALPDWNQALRSARGRLFPLGWWRILRARRSISRIRIFLSCMAPEWKGTGLAAVFLALADQPGTDQYTQIEASWIVDSHQTMLKVLALVGARPYKRYRIYERRLA
jgi:hypothetical protein